MHINWSLNCPFMYAISVGPSYHAIYFSLHKLFNVGLFYSIPLIDLYIYKVFLHLERP